MSGSKREIPRESPQQDTHPHAYGLSEYPFRSWVEIGDDQRTNSSDNGQSKAAKQNFPRSASPPPAPPASRGLYPDPYRPPSSAGYADVTSPKAQPPTGSTASPEEDSPYREFHQHANNPFPLWADIVDDERTNPVLRRAWHRSVGDQYTEVTASPTPSQEKMFARTAAEEERRAPEPRGGLSGQELASMIDRIHSGLEPRALSPDLSYREREGSVSPENTSLQDPVDIWTHPHKPYNDQSHESVPYNLGVKIEVMERRATLLMGPHEHNAHPFSLRKMTLRDYQDSPPLQGEGRVRIIHFERYGMEPGQKEALNNVFKLPEAFWGAKGHIGGFYGSRKFKEPASGRRSRRQVVVRRESILLLIGKFHSKNTKNFHWASPHFYLRANGSSVNLFCLDIRRLPTLVSTFADSLTSSVTTWHVIRNPFLLYTFIFREWRFLSTSVFWGLRDRIFKLEEADSNHDDYKSLHELAKHVTQQANEVQSNALDLIMSIEQDHDAMIKDIRMARSPYYDDPEDDQANEEWECYENTASELKSLVLAMKLSQSSYVTLERRVANQINLAFNLAQQRDSRVATNIADATRTDSIAMKTISIVTLVFLPATAVGTIFSMPFFENPDGQRLQLTRDFWIYWVVTVPITILTVGVWHFWQQSLKGEDSTASDRLRGTRVGLATTLGRGEDKEQSMTATEQLKKTWARRQNADVEPGTYEVR